MLTEEGVTYAEKNFLSDLEKLEAEFNERNKSMDVPYKCINAALLYWIPWLRI